MPTTIRVLQIGRDARTGWLIPVAEAHRRPRTTVVETIRYRPRPSGRSPWRRKRQRRQQ